MAPSGLPSQGAGLSGGVRYSHEEATSSSYMKSDTTFGSIRRTPEEFETLGTPALGQGSYGKVVMVRDKMDGTVYAMKIIDKKFHKSEVFVSNLKLEIRIHKRLRHPHIVRMRFFMEDTKAVYLVMEYVENGNLNMTQVHWQNT